MFCSFPQLKFEFRNNWKIQTKKKTDRGNEKVDMSNEKGILREN